MACAASRRLSGPPDRPLRSYSGPAIAFPLGGIGTGNVSLAADGSLTQWEIHNQVNHRGDVPETLFALRSSCIEPPHDVRRVLRAAPAEPVADPAVCTWPRGGRPAVPIRYADEVWSGTEYQVAAHCLYEGLNDEATALVGAVRGRMTGARRNPFNEIECGDHYARAMSGWSLLGASTGFRHDAPTDSLGLVATPGRYPFLTGSSWGVLDSDGGIARLEVRHGELRVRSVSVEPGPRYLSPDTLRVQAGEVLEVPISEGRSGGLRVVHP